MAYSNSWVNTTPAHPLSVTIAPSADDVLVGWFLTDTQNGTDTVTLASGWSLVGTAQVTTGDNQTLWVAIKNQATGSETAFTASISSGNQLIGGVASFSGRDNTTPQDVAAAAAQASTNSTNTPTVGITPVTDGCDIIAINGADVTSSGSNPTFTFSGGSLTWTTRQDQHSGFLNAGVGTATQATAGAITVTCTRSVSSGNAMKVLALKPAAGGGSITGALSATLGVATLTSAAGLTISGSAAGTLAAVSSSSAGSLAVSGSLVAALGAVTAAAAGDVVSGLSGATEAALGALTATGAAALTISGAASITLGAASSSSVATLAISGALSASLGALTAASEGVIAGSVEGSVTQTLGQLAVSAAGDNANPLPRRGGGSPRRGYIYKGQRYYLTPEELAVLIAQDVIAPAEVKRVSRKQKAKAVDPGTWAEVEAVLKRLEKLTEPEDDDEEEEALLLLI